MMYLQEERANSLARTNHLSTFLLQSSTLMNSPNFLLLSPPGCPHQLVAVVTSDTDRRRLPALCFPTESEPLPVQARRVFSPSSPPDSSQTLPSLFCILFLRGGRIRIFHRRACRAGWGCGRLTIFVLMTALSRLLRLDILATSMVMMISGQRKWNLCIATTFCGEKRPRCQHILQLTIRQHTIRFTGS